MISKIIDLKKKKKLTIIFLSHFRFKIINNVYSHDTSTKETGTRPSSSVQFRATETLPSFDSHVYWYMIIHEKTAPDRSINPIFYMVNLFILHLQALAASAIPALPRSTDDSGHAHLSYGGNLHEK